MGHDAPLDAAGTPGWARDARGIETTRTFDTLNRPLIEHSDDGSGAKLRRAWNDITYDETDPGHRLPDDLGLGDPSSGQKPVRGYPRGAPVFWEGPCYCSHPP